MTEPDALAALTLAITELDETTALALVQSRLEAGQDPFQIMAACQAALRQVGERYEQREYYLSGLIMAGEIFREVIELLQPVLAKRPTDQIAGDVVLGTVQGDIHDIGKNMLGMLLTTHGFRVLDLGVDVAPDDFVARTLQVAPDVVALSCLLTSAYEAMKTTVALLKTETARRGWALPVVIGGGLLDEHIFRYIGADYWATDAMDGVRLCLRLAGQRRGRPDPRPTPTQA